MRVIDVVGIPGVLLRPNPKGGDPFSRPVGVHDGLREAGRLIRRLREKAVGPRERPKIGIKGSVLLVEYKDILDVLPKERDELIVCEIWLPAFGHEVARHRWVTPVAP